MEDVSRLIRTLCKNIANQAFTETMDLVRIANIVYSQEFIEMYSIVYPEKYEINKLEIEEIQNKLLSLYIDLKKINMKMKFY